MAGGKDVGEGNTQYENVIDLHVLYTIANFEANLMCRIVMSRLPTSVTVNGKIANQSVDPIHLHC
jgi:hypothetical protein